MKLTSFAILLIGLGIISCKKNSTNPPPDPDKDCRVTIYRCDSRNETWRIVYNPSGSIDSILIGDALTVDIIRTFSYNQDKITVKRFYNGVPETESHVETAAGRISSIRDQDSPTDWKQVSFAYTPDAKALLEGSINSFYGTNFTSKTYYYWDINTSPNISFNMKTHSTPSGELTYEYHFDKPTQAGDYLNFEKIISTYDRFYNPFTSTGLLKAIKLDGDPLVDVTYTFDTDGKITSFAVRYDGDPEAEIWKLTYKCD